MVELTIKHELFLFFVAGVLGSLIGLERQFSVKGEPANMIGVRTFAFISLLGAVSAFISTHYIVWFPAVTFAGMILLVSLRYFFDSSKGDVGITTEMTELLVFMIGAITFWGHITIAIALAVGITFVLSLKPEVKKITARVDGEDIRAVIKFAVISFVILPVLPDRAIDSWGLFNPREVWLMVVLISAVSFVGYLLLKFARVKGALELTGLIGGLVSSTAVTLSFSRRSAKMPSLSGHLAVGIILACSIMLVRLLIIIGFVEYSLIAPLLIPFCAMAGIGAILIVIHLWRHREGEKDEEEDVEMRNPFEISSALTFGALYALIKMFALLTLQYYGKKGLYTTALISGIANTDAISLSLAQMVGKHGAISVEISVAAVAITMAAVTNTVFKGSMVMVLASNEVKRKVLMTFIAMALAGVAGMAYIWPTDSFPLIITRF